MNLYDEQADSYARFVGDQSVDEFLEDWNRDTPLYAYVMHYLEEMRVLQPDWFEGEDIEHVAALMNGYVVRSITADQEGA
jgi:hypothetical protein